MFQMTVSFTIKTSSEMQSTIDHDLRTPTHFILLTAVSDPLQTTDIVARCLPVEMTNFHEVHH